MSSVKGEDESFREWLKRALEAISFFRKCLVVCFLGILKVGKRLFPREKVAYSPPFSG